jgi:hypothetical protein
MMKHLKKSSFMCLFAILLMVFSVSCTPANPVQFIKLFHTSDGAPPSYIPTGITMPSPDETMLLSPGDKIFLFVMLDKKYKGDINFSRITFFNKGTSDQIEIGSSHDLGPFTPGSILDGEYYVPIQTGKYEVRIYVKDKVVARALFEVK